MKPCEVAALDRAGPTETAFSRDSTSYMCVALKCVCLWMVVNVRVKGL